MAGLRCETAALRVAAPKLTACVPHTPAAPPLQLLAVEPEPADPDAGSGSADYGGGGGGLDSGAGRASATSAPPIGDANAEAVVRALVELLGTSGAGGGA